jgi:hypothetical protein
MTAADTTAALHRSIRAARERRERRWTQFTLALVTVLGLSLMAWLPPPL